jgi:hypothetical protein
MKRAMSRNIIPAAVVVLVALASTPAAADAGNFTLVNGTGRPMSDVSIRRFGAPDWRPLGVAPAAGSRAQVTFSDPDCAFDIRAQLGGVTAIWSGVNLCEVRAVTLKREASGELWVEYD